MNDGLAEIPDHLTRFGAHWLVLEALFVGAMIFGLVAIWRLVCRHLLRRDAGGWRLVAEGVFVVPWLAFPVLFGLALLGQLRVALVAAQAIVLIFAVHLVWSERDRLSELPRRAASAFTSHWINAVALASVALFALWGWLMPFPEIYNGHHHSQMSLLAELWQSGAHPLLDQDRVAYDTEVLASAPPFTYLLALFALPGVELIATRPTSLLGGAFALLTLQLMRLTGVALVGRALLGSIAFLLVAFSYYAAGEATEITPDVMTSALVAYFTLALVRWAMTNERDVFALVFALAFAALVRKQLVLLFLGALVAVVVCRVIPWRDLLKAVRRWVRTDWPVAALIAGPFVVWTVFATVRYGSPLFPQESRTGAFGLIQFREFFGEGIGGRPHLLVHYLPAFWEPGLLTTAKNLLSGLSASVAYTLLLGAFLVGATRFVEPARGRKLRRFALALIAGALVIQYLVFPLYPKYPHYVVYLLAPFAGIPLLWALTRGGSRSLAATAIVAAVAAAGWGFWLYNSWGHAHPDTPLTNLTNAKLLLPGYGQPVDRLSRRTGQPPERLDAHLAEHRSMVDSLGPDENFLLAELEPGSFIPALLGEPFLGDAYYLETDATSSLVEAQTDRDLRSELDRLRIRHVYRLGRAHPSIEDALIVRKLERLGAERDDLIFSADELVSAEPRAESP